jgi:hypothetical protein
MFICTPSLSRSACVSGAKRVDAPYIVICDSSRGLAWQCVVIAPQMVAGTPPFYADDPMATYEKILGNNLQMPDYFSKVSAAKPSLPGAL